MFRFLLLFGISYYFNCSPSFSQVKQVIVIGVDGMGSHGIRKSCTPVMDSIMKAGAYTLKAKAVFPTLSSPNWASMTKGVNPQHHRITSNDWEKKEANEKFPSIFKVIRQMDSLAEIAIFHQWKGFSEFVESDVQVTIAHAEGEEEIARSAADYLSVHKPVFTFIHLDHVDHQGHLFGERSREYKKSIAKSDSLIGLILSAIKSSVSGDSAVILITADHGFKKNNHGGWSKKEKQIPWLIAGYGIKNGCRIKKKVHTYDTAAMIAYLLSIEAPASWKGKPITGVLKNE